METWVIYPKEISYSMAADVSLLIIYKYKTATNHRESVRTDTHIELFSPEASSSFSSFLAVDYMSVFSTQNGLQNVELDGGVGAELR